MNNLKDFSQAFWTKYRESRSLTETVGDKVFLVMSNLYFFNLSRGMQVDFNKSFLDNQVSNFANDFLVRATQ
jgi:hypothetical protein